MRGKDDIGDAGAVGPRGRGNNRSGGGDKWGDNKGRKTREGAQGRTQNQQKSLRNMKEGRP